MAACGCLAILVKNLLTFHTHAGVTTVASFWATNHGAKFITYHPGNQENGEKARSGHIRSLQNKSMQYAHSKKLKFLFGHIL